MTTAAVRVRRAVIFACGGLAVAVLIAFSASFLTRKSEVAQLLDIIADPNAPDAAWAFEELKKVSDEDLDDLLPFVNDERVTAIHSLKWNANGVSGGTGFRPGACRVHQIVSFVLAARLDRLQAWRNWEIDRPPRSRFEWEVDLSKLRASSAHAAGGPAIGMHTVKQFLRWVYSVGPPSYLAECNALACRGDPLPLIETLKGDSKAEIAWTVEALRSLPDDALDRLAPLAACTDLTGVTDLTRLGLSYSSDAGVALGYVVQFVLNERMGRPGSERPTLDLDPQNVERVQSSWVEFRRPSQ